MHCERLQRKWVNHTEKEPKHLQTDDNKVCGWSLRTEVQAISCICMVDIRMLKNDLFNDA